MRFLHCADVHLGGANAAERMRTFLRMLDFCAQNRVQLLLIAGDLFETARADARVRTEAFEALARQSGLSVLIAAGNHDPLCAGGNYDAPLPDNVYVFPARWSCVGIEELKVRVWGKSFDKEAASPFAPPERDARAQGGYWQIGLLHGQTVTGGASSEYGAVTQEAIAKTGLDYLALGHVHQRSDVLRAGRTYYAYSGCLQGAGFDETGEKGAYLGDVDEDGLEISFVRLCGSICAEETLDITGCETVADAAARYEARIGRKRAQRVRLTLTGMRAPGLDPEALLRLLGENGQVALADETRQMRDLSALAGENTLRGAFVRRMTEKIAAMEARGEDAESAKLALRYGLEAFEGEVRPDAH